MVGVSPRHRREKCMSVCLSDQKMGGTEEACNVLVEYFVVIEQETDSSLKNKLNVELLIVFKSLHRVLPELLSL